MKPKKELVRIVRSPDKVVIIDGSGKSAGRGAYICMNRDCVAAAKKGRRIEKNLEVPDCPEIYAALFTLCDGVENGLRPDEAMASMHNGAGDARNGGGAALTQNGGEETQSGGNRADDAEPM
jgi:predicted RNA-binding protein YlxR (DUF448 family)